METWPRDFNDTAPKATSILTQAPPQPPALVPEPEPEPEAEPESELPPAPPASRVVIEEDLDVIVEDFDE
jgi:hypothetical protein